MKCPVCKTQKLIRCSYENVLVAHCNNCAGYLVRKSRINAIKNAREKSDEEFLDELSSIKGEDSTHKLFCPGCLRGMNQRRNQLGSSSYFVNDCEKCRLVCFDCGELAKMQLRYEEGSQGKEMERFRERLANMTEEERMEFAKNLSKLREESFFDSFCNDSSLE